MERRITISETKGLKSRPAYYRVGDSPLPVYLQRPYLLSSLTTDVLQESLELETPVIVSYHPPVFKGLKSITLSNPLQASLLRCAAEGISVYSPHTSMDSVWGGVNDWLAESLLDRSVGDSVPLVGIKKAPNGEPEGGEGRLVTFPEPLDLSIVISRIKKTLGLSQSAYLRIADYKT